VKDVLDCPLGAADYRRAPTRRLVTDDSQPKVKFQQEQVEDG